MSLAPTVVLDASALTDLADGERRMLGWMAAVLDEDSAFVISAVTLAETTDGTARDAKVRRALGSLRVVDAGPAIGFRAGALRSRVRRRKARDLTVDGIVAATAESLPGPVVVVTSDPGDFGLLLAGSDVKVAPLG